MPLRSSVGIAKASLWAYPEGDSEPPNNPQDASVTHSTAKVAPPAIPLPDEQRAALGPLWPLLGQLAQAVLDFQARPVCPKATQAFEEALVGITRRVGHAALEATLNSLEPDDAGRVPAQIRLGGTRYRLRHKSPHPVDSRFGTVRLRRWLYESRDGGPSLFPLQHRLGLVAGRATPALADTVGRLVAQHSQRDALRVLADEHGLHWSHETLRKVSAAATAAVGPHRQQAQAEQVIGWLRQAWRGRGRRQPVLAVGRDGITVPLRGEGPHEAAVATVAVYDRRGRRLGTVYLGHMPQAEQAELSRQLTALVRAVLAGWKGRRPRLAYVTDGGHVLHSYYQGVLRRLTDPRTGRRLEWVRVVDFYHAAQYVTKLAEALFGAGGRARQWAHRMRGVLKQGGGLTRLLQSASYHRNEQRLCGAADEAFRKAYNYLWKRRRQMDYAGYRRQGIPIGSGVTEAGCKVAVTQRLKRSGMGWGREGGQVVLTLRCVWLSGAWRRAWQAHLEESSKRVLDTYEGFLHPEAAIAA